METNYRFSLAAVRFIILASSLLAPTTQAWSTVRLNPNFGAQCKHRPRPRGSQLHVGFGLLHDACIVATSNLFSDSVAQASAAVVGGASDGALSAQSGGLEAVGHDEEWERRALNSPVGVQWDASRAARYALFGMLDGGCTHKWLFATEQAINRGVASHLHECRGWLATECGLGKLELDGAVVEAALKSAADAVVYSPVWCAVFLVVMSLLEGGSLESGLERVRHEWRELLLGNLGFFVPVSVFVYGCVPVEQRVAAFAVASVVYTSGLSLWANAKEKGQQKPPAAENAQSPEGAL